MKNKKNVQHTFSWEGKDSAGKKIKGEIISNKLATARAKLKRQGLNITKVYKKKKSFSQRRKKITALDITFLTRQIATMIKAGIPLIKALEITADGSEKEALSLLVTQIKNDISEGNSFSEALGKKPQFFDDLYCNLIAAGEQSGTLETLLSRIAIYKEKTEALKSKIKKALFYPVAVLIIAFIVSAILLIKVVPQFEEIFAGFGAELPAMTIAVIRASEFLQKWWFAFLIFCISAIFLYRHVYKKSQKLRDWQDRCILRLPLIGQLIKKAVIARFCRTLSTTFAAGVPLVSALNSSALSSGNAVYRDAIFKIKQSVSAGKQLQVSMREVEVFPAMSIQMVAIGEESGTLDPILDKVAVFFETEVDNMVDGLTSLLEPIIMAILGVIIGTLIIAMYLPIFQMGNVI